MGPRQPDLDDFIGFMLSTGQLDDNFGLKDDDDKDKDDTEEEESYPKKIGTWKDK